MDVDLSTDLSALQPLGDMTRTSNEISTWVSEHFTAQTVGGVQVYDLTAPGTGAGS